MALLLSGQGVVWEFIKFPEIAGSYRVHADTDMSCVEAFSVEVEKFKEHEAEVLHWVDAACLDGGEELEEGDDKAGD